MEGRGAERPAREGNGLLGFGVQRRGMAIHCAFCGLEIEPGENRTWPDGCCWIDPTSVSVAAHRSCLRRMGELDLDLPPNVP